MRTASYFTAAFALLYLAGCGGGGSMDDAGAMPAAPAPLASSSMQQGADASNASSSMLTASSAQTPLRATQQASASATWSLAYSTPRIWHSLSMSTTGDVIVAGEAGGPVRVSSDGGVTWTAGNSTNATWIASATSSGGGRIFALQYGGSLMMSTDLGHTWRAITSSPLVYSSGGLGFEGVTVSQDGQRVAVVIQNGAIVLSSDGGSTWRRATTPDGVQNHWWRWIDGSNDGSVLVAVSHNGEIFRSTDAGASWRALSININGTAYAEHWYRVKVSNNGQTIAVVANSFGGGPGSGIFVSRDGGTTWTRGYSLVADYTFIAMSGDGATIAASMSDTNGTPGRVLLSSDGGASFSQVTMPGSDTDWRAIAMSSVGDRFAAATGAFNTQTTGLLYRGQSSTTAPAPSPTPAPAPSPTPAPAPGPAPAPSPTPAPAPAPTCNPAAWNSTTRYFSGNTVMRNSVMYVALPASDTSWNVNSPPEWTPSYWAVTSCSSPAPAPAPAPSPTPAPAPAPAPAPTPAPSPAPAPASCSAIAEWNSSTRYFPGDKVMRLGTMYTAKNYSSSTWNVNSPPEWTPSYWAAGSC